jgi:hypothetical protein
MNDKALSAEQAIAALSGDDMPDDVLDAEEEQDTELDAEAEFQAEADEEGDDPDTDPDADEDEEGDEPGTAIEAPQFLDEKERAAFAALPRAAQEMLLKHDKALVADYTRKTQAVAEEKKAVQAQRQQLDRVVSQFGEVLPEAEREFAEWQKFDWVRLAQMVTAEEYNQYRANAEAAGKRVSTLRTQKAQAEQASFQTFLSEQKTLLTSIAEKQAPEFLKPDAGEKVIKPLVTYIKELGYSDDEITHIGAQDMIIAYKAMKYDQMVAARKNGKPALTPKPDAKSTGKPVRAGAAVSTSKRAVSKDLQQRFNKTGSKDLAIELLKNFD